MINMPDHNAAHSRGLARGIQPFALGFGLTLEPRVERSPAVTATPVRPIGSTRVGLVFRHLNPSGVNLIELAEHPHEGHR